MGRKKKEESQVEDVLNDEYNELSQFDDNILDDIDIGGKKSDNGFLIEDETFDDFDTKMSNKDAESIKAFLETETFLNKIRLGLENKEKRNFKITTPEGKTKSITVVRQIPNTKPLANETGVSQIMARIYSIISKDISLGNIDWERYDKFMKKFKINFITQLVIHAKDWDIPSSKIKPIYDIVCDPTQMYLTRPVGDKERGIFGGKDQNYESRDTESSFGKKLGNIFSRKNGRN